MGRAKKSRKVRAANRRRKRIEKAWQRYFDRISDLRAARAERRVIEASELPEELKKALGLLVDPVGAVYDMMMVQMTGPRSEEDYDRE